jgi:hypothetical protein
MKYHAMKTFEGVEVSGQLNAPAALFPVTQRRYQLERR